MSFSIVLGVGVAGIVIRIDVVFEREERDRKSAEQDWTLGRWNCLGVRVGGLVGLLKSKGWCVVCTQLAIDARIV